MSLADYPRPWRVDGSSVRAANGKTVIAISFDAELSEAVVHAINWTEGVRDAAPAPRDLLPFEDLEKLRDEYRKAKRAVDKIDRYGVDGVRSGDLEPIRMTGDSAIQVKDIALQDFSARARAYARAAAAYGIDITTPDKEDKPDGTYNG